MNVLFFIGLLSAMFLFSPAYAGPNSTTYQAKIIKPDGLPLEASNVNFRFTILDPAASCVLYVEDYAAVNMTGTGGLISFALGMGTRAYPVSSTTFVSVFDNSTVSFPCQSPGIYNPTPADARKIVMQFQDSSGWQTLPAMAINAVPYAMYAGKSENATQLNGKVDTAFVENATLAALNCNTATHAITFNGVSFSCIAVGSGGGGITSVTTSGTVLTTGGTASAPVISITAATMSQDGYLTSLDYAEFKAKLAASSTQIINTLGYAPVSSSAVATQINNSNLSGDVSGTVSSNSVVSVGGKTASQISTSVDDTLAATSSATADTIVKRNSSGNFTANDIYANAAKINYVDIYKPSTSFNIRLQAPTSLSTNYVLNLPTTSGTTGQVLSTDGAGNLSWINPSTGSVVSVSATAPLASSGGSNPTISITQVTSSTDGYLSSTDFNTFNNKQVATSSAIIATLGYTPADSATTVSSQWVTSGTSVYYNTGSVGIGTTAPTRNLQVYQDQNAGTKLSATNPNIGNGAFSQISADVAGHSSYLYAFGSGYATNGRYVAGSALLDSDGVGGVGISAANADGNIRFYTNANNERMRIDASGSVGIGTTSPSAKLHLAAGTASMAPLKFTSGTLLTSAQSGTMEYDGTNFYLTDSTNTRRTIATGSSAETIDNASIINSTGNISMVPVGSVIVSSTTASTNFSTGALVVKGGLGVAGTTNVAQNLNVSGSSVIDGSLKLSTMTSGSVLFAGANGTVTQDNSALYWDGANKRLGLGTNSPAQTLSVSGTSYFSGNVGIGTTAPEEKIHVSNGWLLLDNTYGVRLKSTSGAVTNALRTGVNDQLVVGSGGWNSISFHTGTADKLYIASSGAVGIGTITPSQKLEVSGVIQANDGFKSTTNGINTVLSADAQGSYLESQGANNLRFYTNSSERVRIEASGNVGIGTTSPVAKLTSVAADSESIVGLSGNAGNHTSIAIGRTSSEGRLGIAAGVGSYADGATAGDLILRVDSSSKKILLAVGTSETMTITSGNVGIGTTSPQDYGASYKNLEVKGGTANTGGIFQSSTSDSSVKNRMFVDSGLGYFGTSTNHGIGFQTSGTERIRVDSAGNVGIGTTAPAAKLHVEGDLRLGSEVPAGGGNYLVRGEKAGGAIQIRSHGALGGDSDRYLRLGILDNALAFTPVISIPSSGNVGIGTTAPSAKLHLAAGTVSTAPFKFTSGTLLSSPQSGSMEFDGSAFYLTDGVGNRRTIAAGANPSTIDDASYINSTGNITMTPVGSVVVSSTTASTNSATGALIVNGGAGIAGNLNVSGTISSNSGINLNNSNDFILRAAASLPNDPGDIVWTNSDTSERARIYSGTASSPVINFSVGSSPSTKMTILENGNVGVGTTAPDAPFEISSTNDSIFRLRQNQAGDVWNYIEFYNDTNRRFYAGTDPTGNFRINRDQATGNLLLMDSGGNVGIGTTSPSNLLSNISTSLGYTNVGDSESNGQNSSSLSWASAASGYTAAFVNGSSAASADGLQVRTAGVGSTNRILTLGTGTSSASNTDVMVVQGNGNVGIGTTSPAAKLHLNGSDSRGIALSPGTTTQRIDFLHNDNGNVNAIYANIRGVLEDGSAGRNYGHLVLATAPNTAGNPATVERVRITGNGNVGIGTSAPAKLLQISGSGDYATASEQVRVTDPVNNTTVSLLADGANSIGAVYAGRPGVGYVPLYIGLGPVDTIMNSNGGNVGIGTSSPGAPLAFADSLSDKIQINGNAANSYKIAKAAAVNSGDSLFKFVAGATAAGEFGFYNGTNLSMLINSSGNVGIGTIAPTQALSVSGNIQLIGGLRQILLGNAQGIVDDGVANLKLLSNGATDIYFSPNGSEAMRVKNGGNVGIGTTAPAYTLDVSGTLRVTGTAYTNGGYTTWTAASDMRLKDIHGSYDRGLDDVLGIKIIKFQYKADNKMGLDSSKEFVGVTAQNLQTVIPEAVTQETNGQLKGYLTINTTPVLWTLVNAVKQLYNRLIGVEAIIRQIASIVESKADKAEIEEFKQKVANLEIKAAEVDAIKAKSDKLEAENAALIVYLCSKDPAASICK